MIVYKTGEHAANFVAYPRVLAWESQGLKVAEIKWDEAVELLESLVMALATHRKLMDQNERSDFDAQFDKKTKDLLQARMRDLPQSLGSEPPRVLQGRQRHTQP